MNLFSNLMNTQYCSLGKEGLPSEWVSMPITGSPSQRSDPLKLADQHSHSVFHEGFRFPQRVPRLPSSTGWTKVKLHISGTMVVSILDPP